MKNLMLLIVLTLAACSSVETPSIPPVQTPVDVSGPIETSPSVMSFGVKIKDTNYYDYQKEKLKLAISHLENIFNSTEYKKEMLSRELTSTNGKTNQQVFDHLMKGMEVLIFKDGSIEKSSENQSMDLTVEMYYSKYSKVIGYTYPDSLTVWTNSKFHDYYDACDVASNLAHEWTHKMGYDHLSASDWTSVPYQTSTLVRLLCTLSEQGKLIRR